MKKTKSSAKAHSYTPIADLAVELKDARDRQHLFLVSSACLRVASLVWRKTLDPDSKFAPLKTVAIEGRDYKKISIEGVEADALRIIFSILHYKTKDIPIGSVSRWLRSAFLVPPFAVLRDVAMLVDQYDCALIVTPWACLWVGSGQGWALDPDYLKVGCEDWIFIASVLSRTGAYKCEGIIKIVSKELIQKVLIDTAIGGPKDKMKFYRREDEPNSQGVAAQGPRPNDNQAHKIIEVNLEMIPEKILGIY